MPTRGNARKIGMRVDAKPVSSARQYGELADSANRIGTCTRMPLATWIALSASSMPTCTCSPKMISWRATKRRSAISWRYRGREETRWSSHIANGCVPAEPMHRLRRAAASATSLRNCRSSRPAERVSGCGSVAISRTDSSSSSLTCSPSPYSSRTASIALARANVSESRIMSSSSMPIVKLGLANFGSIGRVEYEALAQTDFRSTGGRTMALGYDGKLYILAFDHRGSFQKKMFGIEGDPTEEQTATITDAKRLIFEGMENAVERGIDAKAAGVLVDEQFGGDVPKLAREHGLSLTMPVEKSGQDEFDFQYGEGFGKHIENFELLASKVLVRYNPDGDPEMNERQTKRLKQL